MVSVELKAVLYVYHISEEVNNLLRFLVQRYLLSVMAWGLFESIVEGCGFGGCFAVYCLGF